MYVDNLVSGECILSELQNLKQQSKELLIWNQKKVSIFRSGSQIYRYQKNQIQ